jgi:hypothetical protein
MKLVRFGPEGEERPGLYSEEGTVIDVSAEIDDFDRASAHDGRFR